MNSTQKNLSLTARAARKARHINKSLYVDLNHDLGATIFVAGSGRSGTTWLAELLARQLKRRLIFEPFHPRRSPVQDRLRFFLAPDDLDSSFAQAAEAVLAGRVRSRKFETAQPIRLPRGRVVKDVHAMNALPWFRTNFSHVPIILILRHPIATAVSRLRCDTPPHSVFYGLARYLATTKGRAEAENSSATLGLALDAYDRFSNDREEPLIRYVAEWCVENAYAVAVADSFDIKLCYYENLVLDPRKTLVELMNETSLATTLSRRLDPNRPSSMDVFARAASAQNGEARYGLITEWQQHVVPETTERCLSVLDEFDLSHLYDSQPIPCAMRG